MRFSAYQRRFRSRLERLHSAIQGFCHPLRGKGYLSQGNRGPTHRGRMEYAYDFGTPIGTPVYAMQSGRVIGIQEQYADIGGTKSQAQKANFVWLKHTQGIASAYTHLQQDFSTRTSLRLNDWVKAGQLIGYSGNSGWSSAPHLHVEVHHITAQSFGQTLPFSISSDCGSEKLT
ncbi:M23 family metallopeptidase [Acaryochloris marina]|uniref:M23 family metallopeptidase n=1 Tax=Acaryochloris marina TaxID=155978 RepID=UPI0021C2D8DF|nr:M23 family metallopeptidase [Acaryochloris marina]